ncbi:MAG: RNA polymerase sigma factor [Phycisphaerae bacterium]
MRLTEQTTTTVLLDGLHDSANHAAWMVFQERYVPIMQALARRLGLHEADAADVTQEALVRFLTEYRAGRFNRERGRLRAWLVTILRYRVADRHRAMWTNRTVMGGSAVERLPADDELESAWEAEQRQVLLQLAFQRLREDSRLAEQTIRAFERLVLDERSVAEVAAEFGMTPNDVYVAKSRVLERLRSSMAELDRLYAD